MQVAWDRQPDSVKAEYGDSYFKFSECGEAAIARAPIDGGLQLAPRRERDTRSSRIRASSSTPTTTRSSPSTRERAIGQESTPFCITQFPLISQRLFKIGGSTCIPPTPCDTRASVSASIETRFYRLRVCADEIEVHKQHTKINAAVGDCATPSGRRRQAATPLDCRISMRCDARRRVAMAIECGESARARACERGIRLAVEAAAAMESRVRQGLSERGTLIKGVGESVKATSRLPAASEFP